MTSWQSIVGAGVGMLLAFILIITEGHLHWTTGFILGFTCTYTGQSMGGFVATLTST